MKTCLHHLSNFDYDTCWSWNETVHATF